MNLFSIASYVWERMAIVFFRNRKHRDWIINIRKRSIDTRKEISTYHKISEIPSSIIWKTQELKNPEATVSRVYIHLSFEFHSQHHLSRYIFP